MARPRAEQPNYRLVQRGRRYYVRWWENGQWKRLSTGTEDRRAALIWLRQFEAGQGTPAAPVAPTIARILEGYLADRRDQVAAFATLQHAASALTRHLGDLEPDHLTTERARFYARGRRAEGYQVGAVENRRRKPVSNGTIAREIVTLRAALRWAVNQKWITTTPSVPAPPAGPPRDRWLRRNEAARLLIAAQAFHVRTFIALALYTAARSGAILQLQWSQVDFKHGLIDYGGATGNKGRSVVPISPKLRATLQRARRLATSPHVIEHGGRSVASVKTGFAAACRRAGLIGVSPHILRHTAATWMAMAGVPMRDIALMLGHRNTTVTEAVYAKWHPDYLRRAANAIGLKGGPLGTENSANGAGMAKSAG